MSNPILRRHMHFYPEESGKMMSQVWHGGKMREDAPRDLMTPMAVNDDGKVFYVGELARRTNGNFFVPIEYFTDVKTNPAPPHSSSPDAKPLHAIGYTAILTQVRGY